MSSSALLEELLATLEQYKDSVGEQDGDHERRKETGYRRITCKVQACIEAGGSTFKYKLKRLDRPSRSRPLGTISL